jgi:hypothetical protein
LELQVDQSDHGMSSQSTGAGVGDAVGELVGDGVGGSVGASVGDTVGAFVGHAWVLHVCCFDEGHAVPPLVALVLMTTLAVCVPPPHSLVHVVHGSNVCEQFTGHAWVRQFSSSCMAPHSAPP